ncbi:cytochrome P450 [Parasphingorhabdus halotolerans]|uniref:Cytochrome P450 n=1 Tax=Parasphingorhabdus halotolerans TaxID=2725558 RepID=A0A6H2DNR0_9SPHN|nr:cytochrome P450 [Parasphingorhabdus halotolerans]QJB69296.1 cytochrome P450 [Parasphingorhabdus halotolerans]
MQDAATPDRPTHSFDIYHQPSIKVDVHDAFLDLKENAPPLFWTPENGGHWIVTDGDMMIDLLRKPNIFSNQNFSIPHQPDTPKTIPLSLDPPEHRPYRQMLRPFFEKKAIAPLNARIQEWADRLICAVKDQGECEFVDAVGSRFPVSVFMEMLGLSMDRFDEFRGLVQENFAKAGTPDAMDVQMRIVAILAAFVKERQAEPKDDMMSQIIQSDIDGRALSFEELLSIAHLLFLAGLDTVVNALSFAMKHLAGDEVLQRRIMDDPACIPDATEELLRRYSFVNLPRMIAEDTELGGQQLRKGEKIICPLAIIGWEEKLNDNPLEVSVDRKVYRHGAFGSGIHTCIGLHLARMELHIFFATWFREIGKFRLHPDKKPGAMRGGVVWAIEELWLEWE